MADFSYNDLLYVINDPYADPITVTLIGPKYTNLSTLTVPDTVYDPSNNICAVTSIANFAFYNCELLRSVTIGNNVGTIGDLAFYNCAQLKTLVIGNSVQVIGTYSFYYCEKLKDVIIPNSVETISDGAFLFCTSLNTISIGHGVNSIGDFAFYYLTSLIEITVDPLNSFYESVDGVLFNKGQTILLQYPLGNLAQEYTIPFNVETIEAYSFSPCVNLANITFENNVKNINDGAFRICTGLETVTIKNSVINIGDLAFAECDKLKTISIGKGVQTIGLADPFYNCISLENIIVDPSNVAYSSGDENVLFNYEKTVLLQYPIANARTYYKIPDSVETIYDHAFSGCKKLINLDIGNQVKYIREEAFSSCIELLNVSIPDSVQFIYEDSFAYCDKLVSVQIGTSVETIGQYAFYQCPNLIGITVDSSNPYFKSDEGVLFDHGQTLLIQYPIGNVREYYKIPDITVKKIEENSFYGAVNLKNIEIGNAVEIIGYSAFSNCINLLKINIPDSVVTIDGDTFSYCDNLIDVIIGKGVEEIGSSFLLNCFNLETITVDPSNVAYESENQTLFNKGQTSLIQYSPHNPDIKDYVIPDTVISVEDYAFAFGDILETLIIGNNVESIGYSSFYGCSTLTTVTIPDSVLFIDEDSFSYCYGLYTVIIGANLVSIGDYSFYSCVSLERFIVSEGNTNFSTIYDVLFDYSQKILIQYPIGIEDTSYYVPNGVEIIGIASFAKSTFLTDVLIPGTVTNINSSAFKYCTGLTSITFPSSVEFIQNYAFLGCSSLLNIYFFGNIPAIGEYSTFGDIENSNTAYYVNDSAYFEDLFSIFINVVWLKYISQNGGITNSNIKDTRATISWNAVANVQKGSFTGEMNYYINIGPISTLNKNKSLCLSNKSFPNATGNKNAAGNNNATSYTFTHLQPNTEYSYTLSYFINDVFLEIVSGTFTTTGMISPICFIGTTRITTDQGDLEIQNIEAEKNTIRGKKIIAITKTSYPFETLVKIEKNAIRKNVPKEPVVLSGDHKVFVKGLGWIKASGLGEKLGKGKTREIKYQGEVMYNILMEKHEVVSASNLKVETLHPNNIIARVYKKFNYENLSCEKKCKLIEKVNAFVKGDPRIAKGDAATSTSSSGKLKLQFNPASSK